MTGSAYTHTSISLCSSACYANLNDIKLVDTRKQPKQTNRQKQRFIALRHIANHRMNMVGWFGPKKAKTDRFSFYVAKNLVKLITHGVIIQWKCYICEMVVKKNEETNPFVCSVLTTVARNKRILVRQPRTEHAKKKWWKELTNERIKQRIRTLAYTLVIVGNLFLFVSQNKFSTVGKSAPS